MNDIKVFPDIKNKYRCNWISVDVKLPPENMLILAYYPEGNEGGDEIDTTTYYGGKLTDTGSSVAYCFEATHWAYLPEAPQNNRGNGSGKDTSFSK